MHLKLTQPLSITQQKANNLPSMPYCKFTQEAKGATYVIEWKNTDAKPMQVWAGIAKESLPAPVKLARIVNEIVKPWTGWYLNIKMPNIDESDTSNQQLCSRSLIRF